MMIAFLVFRQISDLKIAVEVGLVVGMTRSHYPDRFCDPHGAISGILFDNATGFGVL